MWITALGQLFWSAIRRWSSTVSAVFRTVTQYSIDSRPQKRLRFWKSTIASAALSPRGRVLLGGLHDSQPERRGNRLGAGAHLQLPQDGGHVMIDAVGREMQPARQCRIGVAVH